MFIKEFNKLVQCIYHKFKQRCEFGNRLIDNIEQYLELSDWLFVTLFFLIAGTSCALWAAIKGDLELLQLFASAGCYLPHGTTIPLRSIYLPKPAHNSFLIDNIWPAINQLHHSLTQRIQPPTYESIAQKFPVGQRYWDLHEFQLRSFFEHLQQAEGQPLSLATNCMHVVSPFFIIILFYTPSKKLILKLDMFYNP